MSRTAPARPSSLRTGARRRGAALLTSLTLIASLLSLTTPQAAVAQSVADPTTLSLTSSGTFPAGGSLALSAETNTTITGTGRYVSIFDLTTSTRLALCSTGTTCSASSTFYTGGPRQYQAFLTATAPTSPPSTALLSSAVATGERQGWTVNLAQNRQVFAAGETVTITATTNQNVGATNGAYRIYLRDVTTGSWLTNCTTGTTCAATVVFYTGAPHQYQAYVALYTGGDQDVQASSNILTAERQAWTVGLQVPSGTFSAGEQVTLTATSNQDVGKTNGAYRIYLRDLTTGTCLSNLPPPGVYHPAARGGRHASSFRRDLGQARCLWREARRKGLLRPPPTRGQGS